ncbi:MAG: exo-alpha-sialidase [Bacteroidia bacterium]
MKLLLTLLAFSLLISCNQQSEQEAKSDILPSIDFKSASKPLALFAEGIVSTSYEERDIAIAPDEREIIFTRGSYDKSQRVLVSIKKDGDQWKAPEVLPFSGEFQDIEPFFSPDGKTLFFASKRPIFGDSSRSDYNIWYVEKKANTWSDPVALDSVINTPEDEFFPSVAQNGNIYFTATYQSGIGSEDIFISKKEGNQYLPPVALDTNINSLRYEFNAWISPAEDMIIFSSYGREDGYGGGDLYISKKDASGAWSPSRNLGPEINSDKLDYCPFFDQKNKTLYFTSNIKRLPNTPLKSLKDLQVASERVDNGLGNIYRVGFESTVPNSWLIGCWQRLDGPAGTLSGESWELHQNQIRGIGFMTEAGDTVFKELMLIEDNLLTISASQNESAVLFRIKQQSPFRFTASNPEHDFPQHIEYQLYKDTLRARVYNDSMSIRFTFVGCGD